MKIQGRVCETLGIDSRAEVNMVTSMEEIWVRQDTKAIPLNDCRGHANEEHGRIFLIGCVMRDSVSLACRELVPRGSACRVLEKTDPFSRSKLR